MSIGNTGKISSTSNSRTPLVSVCIPTYNGARYLRSCLDGALSQTYKNIEILAVDDCSSDDTMMILEAAAKEDHRVRVVRNAENLGLVGNWNRCVELAQGDWIKYLFQDDILDATCIERMLENPQKPIIFARRAFVFEEGVDSNIRDLYLKLPTLGLVFGDSQIIESNRICEYFVREPWYNHKNIFGEPTAVLLHRSLFERFGLFNRDLAQICDLEYWLRVSVNTGLQYIDDSLAWFRVHQSSISAFNRDGLREDRINTFDSIILLHECAYNEHFKPIVKAARALGEASDYRREVARIGSWLKARCNQMVKESADGADQWQAAWFAAARRYPRLESSRYHFWYALRSTWTRHFGWRFGQI